MMPKITVSIRYGRLADHFVIRVPPTGVFWIQPRLANDPTGLRTLFLLAKTLKEFGLW